MLAIQKENQYRQIMGPDVDSFSRQSLPHIVQLRLSASSRHARADVNHRFCLCHRNVVPLPLLLDVTVTLSTNTTPPPFRPKDTPQSCLLPVFLPPACQSPAWLPYYLHIHLSACLPDCMVRVFASGLLTTHFLPLILCLSLISLCLSVSSYLSIFSSFSHWLSLWLCHFFCLGIYLPLCQFFVTLSAAWSFCLFVTDCSNRRLWLFVSSSVRLTDWRSDGFPGAICG